MFFAFKKRGDLEKLEKLASLKNQVAEVRLKGNLGKQAFHENTKKLFEPVTDRHKNTSENLTKTITEIYINNNKAIKNLNEKLLGLKNDKGILFSLLFSQSFYT